MTENTSASGAADDSLLLCVSDLQHSTIYDNAREMVDCVRAVADRITALAASAPVAPTLEGFVLAPHYRGYANLGTGQYVLNHTAPHEPAELIISIASDEDKAGRTIGDDRGNPAGKAIQPDEMAVRLAFTSVAGLDALEKQLRYLREVHFPQAAPVAPAAQPAPMPYPTDAQIDVVYEQTMGQHLRSQDAPAVRRFGRAMFLCAWNAAAPKAAPRSFQSLFDKMQADPGHDALRADVLAGGNGAPLQQGEYLPLPIGEGTVYCNPDGSLMIDASLAFFDGAKIGDKLYTADQVCAAIDADRAARGAAQAAPAPVAEDAEDAARYRWLKLQARPNEPFELFDKLREAHALVKAFDVFCTRWGGWDASIDAARAQAAQPEGGA